MIYIFDVDGTLTPSRKPMTQDFINFFDRWSQHNTFYLVSGSDLLKMSEQVPHYILRNSEGLFCCGGNDYYKYHGNFPMGIQKFKPLMLNEFTQEYYNEFTPPKDLIDFLSEQLEHSPYQVRAGNHIENRGSMLNFSIVGRDCSDDEREDYFQYDLKSKERELISQWVNERWPDITAVIGGQISIDIAPKGNDKSQVLPYIQSEHPNQHYCFIGDRTMPGGNDYPLANLMSTQDNCSVYQAGQPSAHDGYLETKSILEK